MRPLNLTLIPLLTGLLSGCGLLGGGDLSGDWEGSMDCDGPELDLSMELEADGGGEFSGPFVFLSEQRVDDGTGNIYDLTLEIEYDVIFELDGGGEQELSGDAELADTNCLLELDGDLVSNDCADMGLDEDELDDAGSIGDGFNWDGEDSIEIDDGDCEGELER